MTQVLAPGSMIEQVRGLVDQLQFSPDQAREAAIAATAERLRTGRLGRRSLADLNGFAGVGRACSGP